TSLVPRRRYRHRQAVERAHLQLGQPLPPAERHFGEARLDGVTLACQAERSAQDFHRLAGARQRTGDKGEVGGRLAPGRDKAVERAAALRRLPASDVVERNVELALQAAL